MPPTAKTFGAALLSTALGGLALASQEPAAPAAARAAPQASATAQPQAHAAALTQRQQALIPIAAQAAAGNMPGLGRALEQGLSAGLSVNETKEVLTQLYAYAGFPRSLNALNALMQVVQARQQRGIHDAEGPLPSRPIAQGDALLAAGTANQTRLAGGPVGGPLFTFAPAIDHYLKAHLFGAIFERDNLDWQSRELATVSMLSALSGAESQLQSHMRISMHVGLSPAQLQALAQVLHEQVGPEPAQRARAALERQLASAECRPQSAARSGNYGLFGP